jgi:glycosyltransferase involved in cell wall biosynthesis
MAYCDKNKDVKVRVLGGIEEKVPSHPSIEYLGTVDQERMKSVFADSGVMLNLAYFDWCPNAVVEALVSGLPVICTAGHGVSEIVGNSGIILPIDKAIPRDLARACTPPRFEYEPVYNALDMALSGLVPFAVPEHLYIDGIAKQYLTVMEAACSSKK